MRESLTRCRPVVRGWNQPIQGFRPQSKQANVLLMPDNDPGPKSARERSLQHFAAGYNCAEAVLKGVTEALGCDCDAAPRIATGFGAGIARHGETCGAVVGGVMAIGLMRGREAPGDDQARGATYDAVTELIQSFRAQHGTLCCRELTGCDLLTEEGAAKAAAIDLHHNHCPKFVALAAELSAMALGRNG